MTFKEWTSNRPPDDQRLGQHLFNTAPEHIREYARGVFELDPFYAAGKERIYIVNNFLAFAELVWDVTDEDEMKTAFRMVMAEPNARRG